MLLVGFSVYLKFIVVAFKLCSSFKIRSLNKFINDNECNDVIFLFTGKEKLIHFPLFFWCFFLRVFGKDKAELLCCK